MADEDTLVSQFWFSFVGGLWLRNFPELKFKKISEEDQDPLPELEG